MYQINYASHCRCTTEDGSVFIFIIIILLCSSLPEGHGLHPFRWIANGVQRCVKTHKQHLQEWQPGIPSVPHSPSKSAHVRSHLLRPSSLLPLPCFFSLLLPCRRPIFHLDCWLGTGLAGPAKWIHLNVTELSWLQCRNTIVHYWLCLWSNLGAQEYHSSFYLFSVHMHNFYTDS